MDVKVDELLTLAAAVVAVSIGYGQVFGKYQFQLVEWLVAATAIPSRYRGLLNLAVGVAIATSYSGFAAWQAGEWRLLALGSLAGVFAAVEAAKVHDTKPAGQPPTQPAAPPVDGGAGGDGQIAPVDALSPAT